MKEIRIPKGHGRYREVVAVTPHEADRLRLELPGLMARERALAAEAGTAGVAHGFVTGRSPVTAALRHVGPYAATVTVDLAHWFDSVTETQIEQALQGTDWVKKVKQITYKGRAAQGLPTSPAVANIAAIPMDREILEGLPPGSVYTRYADDLAVSVRDEADIPAVLALLHRAAEGRGWRLAPAKTHVYLSRAGRRVICGVSVGEADIRVPRETRRRLRTAMHAAPNSRRTMGMAEWVRLRLPRAARPQRIIGAMRARVSASSRSARQPTGRLSSPPANPPARPAREASHRVIRLPG